MSIIKGSILDRINQLRTQAVELEDDFPKARGAGGVEGVPTSPEEYKLKLAILHEHLRVAMTLELSTIPPYLCAFYTIKTGDNTQSDYKEKFGDNDEAAHIIRSVVMEEMLHFTLVGNILNAVDGKIKINYKDYVPSYPGEMPDSDGSFSIHLAKFSKSALETFLLIEKPGPVDAPAMLNGYSTIGQFYQAIENLIIALDAAPESVNEGKPLFSGDPARQVTPEYYYGGGGHIIEVHDLASAKDAIEMIVEQGEGANSIWDDTPEGNVRELAHYFKFNEIYMGRRYAPDQNDPNEPPKGEKLDIKYDNVYDMMQDPKTAYFRNDDLQKLSFEFNLLYRQLLDDLQETFTEDPSKLIQGVANMYKMKYKALELMRNPIPERTMNAGPTFEFLTNEERNAGKKLYGL